MIRKYILTGLAILLPIAITVWIVGLIFDLLTHPFLGMIESILNAYNVSPQYHEMLRNISRVLVFILIVAFIYVLGFLAHNFFSKWILKAVHNLFLRIPIIKTIYKTSKEITESFFSPDKRPFKDPVLYRFPNEKSHVYGFLTGHAPKEACDIKEKKLRSLFLPTAPHPISGFLLIVDEEDVKHIDTSVEDIFKTLVSCGLYAPEELKTDK